MYRENKPAIIEYKNGVVLLEEWWGNNNYHRCDGPAVIVYRDGEIVNEEWWLNGKCLIKEDFTSIEMITRLKAYSLFSPIEIAKLKKNAA